MKAISLLQPWATLIMLDYKSYETRSWATKHLGPLAIHASLGKPSWARKVCKEDPHIRLILSTHGLTFDTLPRGVIVGLAEVKGMRKIQEPDTGIKLGGVDPAQLTLVERACGDYTAGRWAWQLQRRRPLTTPVPCTGALSVWQLPDDIALRVEAGEPEPIAHEETSPQVA
jgi:hypothetical protein